MTRSEFVKECAKRCNMTQKDMKEVLPIVGDTIVEFMKDEDGVIPFVGIKFTAVHRDARKGHNIQTGEDMVIPERYIPKVRFGAAIKEKLN